jgi:ankyrin repeat protein
MHAVGASPLRARLASFSSFALLLSAGAPTARASSAEQPACRRAVEKATSSFGGNAFRTASTSSTRMPAHYRHDGVRIQHDPYSPGMAEKYGTPGNTDDEGFDPYADSVGAGIYGGRVKRDASNGAVIIGAQYQNHNKRPGPVYAGGGYTPVSAAIASFAKELRSGEADSEDTTTLGKLLHAFPDLVNDVSTGGATPLHTCGMSQTNQLATKFIIEKGGDIEALDTYGYTPLDRMASNNLAVGARALIAAGADPRSAHGAKRGSATNRAKLGGARRVASAGRCSGRRCSSLERKYNRHLRPRVLQHQA